MNGRILLLRSAPHANRFPGQTEDWFTVLEYQLRPGPLVHLREIDAAEEESRNDMAETVSERRILN